MCDSNACCILCAAAIWGGYVPYSSEISSIPKICTTPPAKSRPTTQSSWRQLGGPQRDWWVIIVIYIPNPYSTVTYPHSPVFDSTANTVASLARLFGEICGRQGLFWLHMTVSTENAIPQKPTKSRNSDFSVFRRTNSNWDLVWFDITFSMESVILVLTYKHACSARSVWERGCFDYIIVQTDHAGLCSKREHSSRSTNKKGLWLFDSNGGDGTVMDFSFRLISRGAHTCTLREKAHIELQAKLLD